MMEDLKFNLDGHLVFFDVSSLIDYIKKNDGYSGIQRVVTELIVEFSRLIDPKLVYLCWCEPYTGRYRCLPFTEVGAEALTSPAKMQQFFHPGRAAQSKLPIAKKYQDSPLKFYFHRTKLDVMSLMGNDAPFRKKDMTSKMWREARFRKNQESKSRFRSNESAFLEVAEKGDYLVLLDSSWQSHQSEAFKTAKSHGLEVQTFVHDLIPIIVPQYTGDNLPFIFYDWLLGSLEYTSRYMTNSEATRSDLMQFFAAHDADLSAVSVPLAQAGLGKHESPTDTLREIGPVSAKASFEAYPFFGDVRRTEERLRHIVGAPYVLCVGTIEARKNVWRLALAWKYLVDQGYTDLPKLVFAGRKGCLREEFEQLLEGTGHIYGFVRIVESPSDEELHLLYKNCQFTVMPSLYEGWGLPVGEALSYGKTAVVALNSSLAEVGGDLVEYCDALSVKSIADAILKLNDPARRTELEETIRMTRLRSWSDVARDMAGVLFSTA